MIRAEVKFKNATFMKSLEKSQYNSIAELSRVSGIRYGCLIDLAGLKAIPTDIKIQVKLSELLNCDLYDLFEQYEEVVKKSKGKTIKISKEISVKKMLSFDSKEVQLLESDYDTNEFENKIEFRKDIDWVINTLKDSEKELIKLHFGIGLREPLALSDIAKRFGISYERTRQIKQKAIRRLRHRTRTKKLKPYRVELPSTPDYERLNYSNEYSRLLEKEKKELMEESDE